MWLWQGAAGDDDRDCYGLEYTVDWFRLRLFRAAEAGADELGESEGSEASA